MPHWGLVPFALSALLTALCAVFVWERRKQPGAKAFVGLLASETLWSIGYTAELASTQLAGKVFWDDVQLLALVGIMPFMLIFLWDYRGRGPKRRRLVLAGYMLVPLLSLVWVWSDGLHGLARATARIEPAPPFGTLLYDFSGIELVMVAQFYFVTFYLAIALAAEAARQHKAHRTQLLLIVVGLLLPTLVNTFGILGIRLLGQRDMAPACFGIAALAVTFALYRKRFLEWVPVARHVVFEQLPDPVLVLDRADRVIDLNPSAQALFSGRAASVGRDLREVVSNDTASRLQEVSLGAMVELAVGEQTFEARSEPLEASRGQEGGRVVLLRDISARKAAERALQRAHEALEQRVEERTSELNSANDAMTLEIAVRTRAEDAARESEQRFRALFDAAVQLMGTLSPDGSVLAANRTALDYGGVQSEDVVGKPYWDGPWWRHSSELRAELREAVTRAARGELVHMEVTHPDRAGVLREFDFSLKPLLSSSAAGLVLIAEARDISDLRRAERERAALTVELHHAQKLDSIGRLAGGIAHDFNNLLTVILGNIELSMLAHQRGREIESGLERAMQAGLSAADLTRQLLAFARKQPTEPRVLSVNEAVEQTHRMLLRLIGEDVQLSLALGDGLKRVRIDPGQLEQILLNLTVNARDAMPSGGELTIATDNIVLEPALRLAKGLGDTPRTYVRLRVTDRGVGMSDAVMAQMFEPFFTTKGPGKGTGIGLSTVYGLVMQASGFVEVESQIGFGTRFDIYLPATDADRDQTIPPPSSEVPRGSESIVLVEDQPPVRDLVCDQLSRLGYRVVTFGAAEEALLALASGTTEVDLLVTDVVLSGMNGPTMVRQLRETRASLKVLYVSGYTNGEIVARGLDEEAEHLLYKPFSMMQLAQAVRGVLEG